MNPAELIQAAYQERPDLIEKTAKALLYLEHTDPEGHCELRDELSAITTYTHEKTAAIRADGLAGFGAAVAGSLASGLAASMATDLYDAARKGLTRSRNYRRIIEANPELAKYDPKRVRRSFNTLHGYAPEFTADPIMGGSILMNMADQPPGMEHGLLQQVIRSRKELLDSKHRQFGPGSVQVSLPDRGALSDTERLRLSQEGSLAMEKMRHENAKSLEMLRDELARRRREDERQQGPGYSYNHPRG